METDELNFEVRSDWPSRKAALTSAMQDEIVDECVSFSTGEFRMREKYDISVLELQDLLLDHNVERCPSCRLQMDSHTLVNDHGEVDGKCTNCRMTKV